MDFGCFFDLQWYFSCFLIRVYLTSKKKLKKTTQTVFSEKEDRKRIFV